MPKTGFNLIGTRLVAAVLAIVLLPTHVGAEQLLPTAPLPQADPATQCAEGVKLFADGRAAEALPLLEAGFAGREGVTFANPDDLGRCALALGLVRANTGNGNGALEAYSVAVAAFRASGNRQFEGATLNNIGDLNRSIGRYAEALEVYEGALAIWRDVGNRTGEGTTLNGKGAVYVAQAKFQEALEAYQQALTIWSAVNDPAGEATTSNGIGSVYATQGRYDEALEAYQEALTLWRAVGDRKGEGTTLNNVGDVYQKQGRYAEALEAYRQARALLREAGYRAGEGGITNNIGIVYSKQGRYAEALEAFQQALAIWREIGDRASEGRTLISMGVVYRGQGRYTQALEVYEQALTAVRSVGDRAYEGVTLANIGAVYFFQRRYADALDALQQALAIQREVGNRDSEGTTLNGIGAVKAAQGLYAEALEAYQQALGIARTLSDRAGEGQTLINVARVYGEQGRLAQALEAYDQALTILLEVGDPVNMAQALSGVGAVYLLQGQHQAALDAFQQALAIEREVGDRAGEGATLNNIGAVLVAQKRYEAAAEASQQALAIAREVGDHSVEGTALNNLGEVYFNQGRFVEALGAVEQALTIHHELGDRVSEGITLHNIGYIYQRQGDVAQALAHYEQAMEILESVRALAGSEAGRAGFIAQYADLYASAVKLYHQQGRDVEAFLTSERGRARAFLDSLATGQVALTDDTAADLLAREQAAYAARQAAQDALAKARALNPPDPALVADLETQLAAAEQEHAAALAAIEARSDQLAALVPGRSTVLDLSQVQALLDSQTTLISYYILGDEGILAFIITRDTFEVVELDVTRQGLTEAITTFRDFASLDDPHPASLQQLYGWLIAPLKPQLKTSAIGVIPHGVLHYLPFAALTDGTRYLSDDYVLFTLPSASALPFIQENRKPEADTVLALGNPVSDEPGLSTLNFAEQEVKAIAELYDGQPLIGKAATESTVRSGVHNASILHLAAHGEYNPFNPLFSAIYLAGDADNDGRLEVREIYGLDLKAATDLVVLSACQTQLGELSAGDEVVGLNRAFLYAGAPTVVASLWNVDDEATALLMERFYIHLREGMGKAQALRQAQVELRAKYPHPYYWAAFVLTGDAGPITAPRSNALYVYAVLGACVLVMAFGFGIVLSGVAGVWGWGRFRQARLQRALLGRLETLLATRQSLSLEPDSAQRTQALKQISRELRDLGRRYHPSRPQRKRR